MSAGKLEDTTLSTPVSARIQELVTIEARMNSLAAFLECVRTNKGMAVNFLGLLNVLIGRRISTSDGMIVSPGLSWRKAAALLKTIRWDKNAVSQLGLDPTRLPLRDRARYWYVAIAQAQVDSPKACEAGDQLADALKNVGYLVSPNPSK
jgi:hypothetical protein